MIQSDPQSIRLKTPGRPGWRIEETALLVEIGDLIDTMRATASHYDEVAVRAEYERLGHKVITDTADPFDPGLVGPVLKALHARLPFSAIRIGDGEANILTYGMYPNAAQLDVLSVDHLLFGFMDSFAPDPVWAATLRDLLFGALQAADMIGILGLWHNTDLTPQQRAEGAIDRLRNNVRALSGNWRGVDYMLRLARLGCLSGKTLCSAHFYFAMAVHLDRLVAAADSVMCITNRGEVVSKLARRYPRTPVKGILLRDTRPAPEDLPDSPRFLAEVEARLPRDMTGCLCLIGAGPWSEIYCTWVKLRGGVAVDIGSAFDLLDGKMTRTIHFGVRRTGKFEPDTLKLD